MIGTPVILLGYLIIGMMASTRFSDRGIDEGPSLIVLIALHLVAVAFAAFAMYMAKRQESGKFLWLTRLMWPVAAIVSYVMGFVANFFI